MSLYIPGLNLPPNCNYCLCRSDTSRYCNAAHEYTPMSGKPDWCPLIEVQPHGRLVDADAFIDDCPELMAYEMLMPTIIPADKEDNR